MGDDLQRPYSVFTMDEAKEKMDKQIDVISEFFSVSKADATVLLMKHRWDSQLVAERLSEDMMKLLTAGLKSVALDSSQDFSDSSSDEFYEFGDDVDDDDDKISTPFCSHKFSTTYWSKYLEKNFFSLEKTQTSISCPHQDCGAAVGQDTIEKLTVRDKDMYEGYVLRSYLEQNKESMIKQCPAPDCSYVIEFHQEIDVEEFGLNVVCLCGHIFCWRCSLESHRPVTCNNASDWLSRDLKKLSEVSQKSLSVSWIETNTKPCPHCQSPVETGRGSGFFRFVPCAYCSGCFCWECMQSMECHKTKSGSYGDCVKPLLPPLGNGAEVDISCVDRWEASDIAMVEAKSELEAFKESNFMSEEYVRIMREGLMLIVQCRQFLKWSCVYDYLHTDYEASKREYLRFLQDYANTLVQSYSETLKEETVKALSPPFDEFICSRGKLSTATSNIGNYFYHFIKTLEDRLDAVKVKSYDDFSVPYWSCDCCTYRNTWLHKVCKMCYVPTASPVEKPSDSSSLN